MKNKLLRGFVLVALLVVNLTLTNQAIAHQWVNYHWNRYGNPTVYVWNSAAKAGLANDTIWEWDYYSIMSLPKVGSSGWNVHVYDGYYGYTGWSGLATISVDGSGHISTGDAKVNLSYGNGDWFDRGVFCQEIGHTLGLDHSNDGGCMGLGYYYTNYGNYTVQHNNDDLYNMYANNHHYTPPPAVGNELVNGHSGKCMDVPSGQTQNGVGIQQWSCNGTAAQKWQAQDAGGGYYYLRSAVSGKCLDVRGVDYNNGAYLQQYDCVGGSNQQWKFVPVGNGRYRLQARHSGRCADLFGSATYDGASIGQWDCHAGANQQWTWR